MENSQRRPLGLLRSILLLLSLNLILPTQALYFYLDGASASPKCFYEELPKDTLVVGHYSALQNQNNVFATNPDLSITVTVDEVFDNDHRVVNTKGSHTGKFTFSAADAGEHRICFTPGGASQGGWLSQSQGHGQVKLTLDLAIGETSAIESTDKGKMSEIAQKIRDLNSRLQDIRREQVFQREREAEFRDQSESTNARVVRWTLLQLVVLGVTCAWQLSHLRAFFIKQKLT
ncbi:emp24p/erv25p- protein [Imshaugia aleurites]|uniref:Emp24p/erv25p- protein n=1 Tax=Imshaugia aleurites TaxID=172621 RepID=A0A8H3EVJ0_9LECA|nr:emp24p/erv25p- protein [Imshaugia aleurites]